MLDLKLPTWLILWIWNSLLGEIYPNIRAIAVRFTKDKELTIRYYLDREPTDDDYESVSILMTNILSYTSSNQEITETHEEVVYSQEFIRDIDTLDGLIYARREDFDND